jgi:ABC-type Mn2+/Zn2+ transport system ATPase subunit
MSTDRQLGAELITFNNVGFGYDRRPVLDGITLRLPAGGFTGVVGPSGSGKTSLLRLMLGTVRAQRGTVTMAPNLAVAYVPQLETVSWNFPVTVAECVLMSRPQGFRWPWASAGEQAEVRTTLDRLGIADLADRHIRELSGGQQQRMFLARALLRRPQLLLLDEPTSGVDVKTRHEVLHLLGELNDDGLTIVLTTHDLNGVAAHLPHLVALQTRLIAEGTPAEVIRPNVLEATFGADMEVLSHAGMPVVIESHRAESHRAESHRAETHREMLTVAEASNG